MLLPVQPTTFIPPPIYRKKEVNIAVVGFRRDNFGLTYPTVDPFTLFLTINPFSFIV